MFQPTKQTAHLTTEELLDREAELFRAEAAARGVVFTAGPFGLFAHKRGEQPKLTRASFLKGRTTGRIAP